MDASEAFTVVEGECACDRELRTWKSPKKRKDKKKRKNRIQQSLECERDSKRRKNYDHQSPKRDEKSDKSKNWEKEKEKKFKRKKGTLTKCESNDSTELSDSPGTIKENIASGRNKTIETLSSQKPCHSTKAVTMTEKMNLEKVREKKSIKNNERSRKDSSSITQKKRIDFQNTNSCDGHESDRSINDDERLGPLTQRLCKEEIVNKEIQNLVNNPLHSSWNFSKEEIKSLREQGIKIKMGSWSKKEIETLEKNMEEYLLANGVTDPAPLIYRKDYDDKESQLHAKQTLFYQNLAKGINRPLFHVYKRVLRMYDPKSNVGRWTEADKHLLMRYHALYGDQWTKIGKLLGRSGNSVNHKVLTLQKSTPGYCKWTKEEADLLNAAVRAATNTDFETQIYSSINWALVSRFVGSRTPEQCRIKWLRNVCWANVNGYKTKTWNDLDDVNLIERLYQCPQTDENDVDWVKMTAEIPNSPARQWLRLRWFNLKKIVPNYIECDFEELLDYLYNVHRPLLKQKTSQGDRDNTSVEY